jgi:vacuolar-type H+-ATPase subunit C/Vma6
MSIGYTFASARTSTLLAGLPILPEEISEETFVTLSDAKTTISLIAPESKSVEPIWREYDFHNLKSFIKGKKADLDDEQILKSCIACGTWSPTLIGQAFNGGTLNSLSYFLHRAFEITEHMTNPHEIDIAVDLSFVSELLVLGGSIKNDFIDRFILMKVDLFNLLSALRMRAMGQTHLKDVYIPRGRFRLRDLETERQIIEGLSSLGSVGLVEAGDSYMKTKKFSVLEHAIDEYILMFLRNESIPFPSVASLYRYFYAVKALGQTSALVSGAKSVGLAQEEITDRIRQW